MHAWLLLRLHAHSSASLHAAVAIDAGLAAFDAKRHGSRLRSHSLLDARFKQVRRRHKIVLDQVPFITHKLRPVLC